MSKRERLKVEIPSLSARRSSQIKTVVDYFEQSSNYHFPHPPEIRHFADGEVLFRAGDEGVEFFIVKDGIAAVYSASQGENPRLLARLQAGEVFGERALLGGGLRTATVIADGPLGVYVLGRERFFDLYLNDNNFRNYLDTLEKIYPLSAIGVVTQFSGKVLGRDAIRVLVRQLGGSAVIATRLVGDPEFSIRAELFDEKNVRVVTYARQSEEIERRLEIQAGRLVGASVSGEWNDIGVLHHLVINGVNWAPEMDDAFLAHGNLPDQLKSLSERYICKCMQVSESTLRIAVLEGAGTLAVLQDRTGAGAVCGGCIPYLQNILAIDIPFDDVVLLEIVDHSEDVRSFRFARVQGALGPAQLGDHVVVAANLDGVQVERAYTLTSPINEESYREITVRRQGYGVFSNYLFGLAIGARLRMSPPRGDRCITLEDRNPLIVFAAGIGVTPALGLTRSFIATGVTRSLHLIQCASVAAGLTGRSELEAIAQKHNWLTYSPHITSEHGRLSRVDIDALARKPKALFLICGPAGFQSMVDEVLRNAGVPDRRIIIETFGATTQSVRASEDESVLAPAFGAGLALLFMAYATLGWPILPVPGWPKDPLALAHQSWTGGFLTGLLLLALILMQSRLPYLRAAERWSAAARNKKLHQWLGAAAPVLLALHASKLGYGISLILTACLLLLTIAALPLQFAFSGTRIRAIALTSHIMLSVAMTGLLVAHLWIALRY